MNKIEFEKRIASIEARNQKVEADKAWERSLLRRTIIALMTYVFIGLYLSWLNVPKSWLNALVPTMGYVLSTLVLQSIKSIWVVKKTDKI